MSFFAIGIEYPKTKENVGTLWRSAYLFGAAFIFTIGRRYDRQASDTTNAIKQIPCFHYADVADMKTHLPLGCRLIGVELHDRASLLTHFVHPKPACYLLGAEDHGLSKQALEQCHLLLQIPHASWCLNVAVAGSIVLYDRVSKEQQAKIRLAAA